jgi:hypothetical protein
MARTRPNAGECLDALGQETACRSDLPLFAVARCSGVSATDRDTIAALTAQLPEIKEVIRVAARRQLCLSVGPFYRAG